ncbi:ParB/RepB/Spo0J family partition protein [Agathobaculum sp.]|jgi:ParB family chromosome partitioning protein|uniref:ParB/RepB/Spo0J family partition protein n=1 Tax=Agathobaculum sp. TaxID=2048138 RepID=UPI001FA987BD
MMKSVLTLVSGREDRVLRRIRISEIVRNPNQPRRYFDPEAIATLAESIRQYGVLNPLTVRRTGNGGYELVAGERRLRAARVAGLTDVPCLLINADGEDSSVIALVENLQRRDLDFFEEANGFKRLIEQFGLTQEEAARKVGKTQSAVANKLRLLRLSQQNMELIRCNNLTERHARALLRLNDEADRINVTNYIIEHELNVSRTEEYIDEFLKAKENPQPVVEAESGKRVVRLFKDVRFFLNTLNRAVGVMVDAGIGATVKQQESDDGLTLTICIPHAKG